MGLLCISYRSLLSDLYFVVFFSFLVSHIVLLVDGPHLKSVTLVTLQAVKLERNNVIVLFPALGGPMGDLRRSTQLCCDPSLSFEIHSHLHGVVIVTKAIGGMTKR